ncbi:hypothetical protein ACFFF5_06390 [Lederbergia wuyishanensis]|uniref:Uncharacterized protein n=1 Tax=Lederbergia wuyishanensis TaxID=1347903 RepID=A0ABU0D2V2_9BACI|nr:hypothetical protein [Lederbergia wuyishanensis]MCJ8007118.1 hypothetical protein [Lederbergia wuyishanensis]MDQ0342737.1 hypothetical protein [Lederbergia wuyishanensis]
MKFVSNKGILIGSMCVIALIISCFFFFGNSFLKETRSISMAGMFIETKHHHIEPGKYLELWVIGYNSYDENEGRFKVYIEDAMVYNLIEEGKVYMVSASSIRKDEEFGHVYRLEQISNQEEYQLVGKGRIK